MRWDDLFDDLESQLEQGISAEETDLRAEEERLRLARLGLRERVASLSDLRVRLGDGSLIRFRPATLGRDWLSGDVLDESDRRRSAILPLGAIASVSLDLAQVPSSLIPPVVGRAALSERLGLGFVLRDLCRRRVPVELWLIGPTAALEPARAYGTIDRVGRDHLDLAVHEVDRPRRDSEVSEVRIVPLAAVALVRV